MVRNKHLIIATYDGVATHYSGVGTIAKNIVNSLKDHIDINGLRVSIAYVNTNKSSRIFNEECFSCSIAHFMFKYVSLSLGTGFTALVYGELVIIIH